MSDRINPLSEIAEAFIVKLGKPNPYIRKFDHYVELIFPGNGFGYQINHDRMNTDDKVVRWVFHLCQKRWITTGHVRAFLVEAEKLGVKIIGDL